MARIRNIKPEFFRHEILQELGPIPMLFFAGLWCQCDKAGNFPWRPAQLKLDILPFIEYDVGTSLEALRKSSMICRYSGQDGKEYGHIPSFREHQRFFGSEAKALPRFPAFSEENKCLELPRNFQGTSKEAPRKTLEVGKLEVGSMEVGSMGKDKNTSKGFSKPSPQEIEAFIRDKGYSVDPMKWLAHYEANGWMVGRNKMKNWKAAIVTWEKNKNEFGRPKRLSGEEAFRA